MKISDFSINHPAIITISLVAVVLFGSIALTTLKQDMLAELHMPTIAIFTVYPGAGPEVVERDVTSLLEDEISTLSGVESISSTSRDSTSQIFVEFDWKVELDNKIADLREKINNVLGELPDEIEGPPNMVKIAAEILPILSIGVESSIDRAELTRFMEDEVVSSLSRITGVAKVNLQGGTEKELRIKLNPQKLSSRGIAVLDVYTVMRNSNLTFPAGSVDFRGKEVNLRTEGKYDSIKEIEEQVVGEHNGTYIRLRDIAEVTLEEEKQDVFVTTGGKNGLVIDVLKQQGADTIEIAEEIKKILKEKSKEKSASINFNIIADQSVDIALAINSVRSSAILGGILAVIILFFFLQHIRTTLIISVSIPLSVLFAFMALALNNQSLNLMTLGGLTVGIGMIVDSSIVVLENIHKKFSFLKDRKLASSKGADEVGGAIVASTTTSLCVFIPLLFVQGLAGTIIRDIALTIVYALTAALVVAVIVVPFLTGRLLKDEKRMGGNRFFSFFQSISERIIGALEGFYRQLLESALAHRFFVIALAVSVLIITVFLFEFVGFEFVPETDMNEIQLNFEAPSGYSLDETRQKIAEAEQTVRELVPELEETVYYTGLTGYTGFSSKANRAFGRLRLISSKRRERSVFDIIALLRRELPARIPDLDVTVINGGLGALAAYASGGQGFVMNIFSNNLDDVLVTARIVEELFAQDPNVEKTELNVSFDRQELVSELLLDYMGNLGITAYEAAMTSRVIFNGIDVGTYREKDRSYPIVLDSFLTDTSLADDVFHTISLPSQKGRMINFAAFNKLSKEYSISEIHHENKMKSILVTGYLKNPDVRGTSSRVLGKMKSTNIPPGVDWEISGTTALMQESFQSLLFSMLVAVFLVYMVMVIQFERYTQPLIVMVSIPFTFIGVVFGLLIFGSTLSIVSFLGIIALAGIVVNNAIVMIDYINLLRDRDKKDLVTALIEGSTARLKPILMTTLTTILATLPMAMGLGEGAEIYSPLGQTIAGGLFTSTLITLFLVPVLYYILERGKLKAMGKEIS